MINSLSNFSAAIRGGINSPAVPKNPAAFSQALLSAATSNNGVSISDAAKSKVADPALSFDFSVNNVNHTQEEVAAHYAEGARQISVYQGLPEGQYDFTRLSGAQAQIIVNDAIANHGALDAEGKNLTGLNNFISNNVSFSGNTPVYSTVEQNVISNVKNQQVSYPDVNGGKFGVPQQSLDWILARHASARDAAFDALTGIMGTNSQNQPGGV